MHGMSREERVELDPIELLREWMKWWNFADEAPAKMPHGLHVRTAVVLAIAEYQDTRKGVDTMEDRHRTCDETCRPGEAHSLACVKARS